VTVSIACQMYIKAAVLGFAITEIELDDDDSNAVCGFHRLATINSHLADVATTLSDCWLRIA
jgi:hypothetical protein